MQSLCKLYHQNHNYASRFFITKYFFSTVCPSIKTSPSDLVPKKSRERSGNFGREKKIYIWGEFRHTVQLGGILDFDAQFYKYRNYRSLSSENYSWFSKFVFLLISKKKVNWGEYATHDAKYI